MKVELLVLYCLFKETDWILPKKSCWASPYLTPLNSAGSHTALVTDSQSLTWKSSFLSQSGNHLGGGLDVSVTNSSIHLHFISWCSSFPGSIRIFVPASAVLCLHLFPRHHCPEQKDSKQMCHWCFSFLHNSRQKMGVLKHWTQEFTCRGTDNWGKVGSDESVSSSFFQGCPTMKSVLCSATCMSGPCGWSSNQGLRWWVLQLCWSPSGHSDWRILPGREVLYSSPPPFPVPKQVRLIQKTSNGKKKKCIKIFTRLQ